MFASDGHYRAMSRNKEVFGEDVEVFRPERFLETERRDPGKFIFGYGRR